MLRDKFLVDALELVFHALDLLPRGGALLLVQLQRFCAGNAAVRAVHDRNCHLQIADQFSSCAGGRFLLRLPLRFEEQRGIVQNAFSDRGRSSPPSPIQLAGFACLAGMFGEDRRHPLAVFQAVARRRDQKSHRHLRRDLARAHLLLDRFRQKLHQGQPPRHPAHAPVEPPRQFVQAVAETLLHLGQQPADLERAFVFAQPQRAIQHHRRGFAHRPNHRFHRVAAQLLQRRDPLVAVNDHVAV